MPELKASQMDMFMAILSLAVEKRQNQGFLKNFFDPHKRELVIPQKVFIDICRIDRHMEYKEIFNLIVDCLKKLCTFVITYEKDEKTIYNFVAFESADIVCSEVRITFQQRFYDMVVNYKYGFTLFELAEFTELNSKYAKILYRLLKQFRTMGKLEMQWQEFLRIMKIPQSYAMRDIEKQILKPAQRELSEPRGLFDQERIAFQNLKYEKIKQGGNKVVKIIFTFTPQSQEKLKAAESLEIKKRDKEIAELKESQANLTQTIANSAKNQAALIEKNAVLQKELINREQHINSVEFQCKEKEIREARAAKLKQSSAEPQKTALSSLGISVGDELAALMYCNVGLKNNNGEIEYAKTESYSQNGKKIIVNFIDSDNPGRKFSIIYDSKQHAINAIKKNII